MTGRSGHAETSPDSIGEIVGLVQENLFQLQGLASRRFFSPVPVFFKEREVILGDHLRIGILGVLIPFIHLHDCIPIIGHK
jgi:hypothetical protein